jgi:hypothetical protein
MWFDINKYNINELCSSLIYKINMRFIFFIDNYKETHFLKNTHE